MVISGRTLRWELQNSVELRLTRPVRTAFEIIDYFKSEISEKKKMKLCGQNWQKQNFRNIFVYSWVLTRSHSVSTLNICVKGLKIGGSRKGSATFSRKSLPYNIRYFNKITTFPKFATFRQSLPYRIHYFIKSLPLPKSLALGNPYLIVFTTLMKSLPFLKSLPLGNPYTLQYSLL